MNITVDRLIAVAIEYVVKPQRLGIFFFSSVLSSIILSLPIEPRY